MIPVTHSIEPPHPSPQSLPFSNFYDVFKLAGNGEPVLIEAEHNMDAAMARVMGLREIFPGHYLIVSRATGKRIFFAAQGAVRQT